ncbi:MFS general substrate transporter [Xylaria palmicola]|nr:MFS general substrate transporter [Xylaria palmicola]
MDDEERPSFEESEPAAPLLGPDRGPFREAPRPWHVATTPRAISAAACLAIFLWVFSGMVVMVPGTRLAEDIFCRRHYGRVDADPIDEALCKADGIQSSIAWVFGLSMALGTVVGLVAVVPCGVLADRARKPVYLLAAAGQFACVAWSLLVLRFWRVLPVELILLASAFQLIGGGLAMAIVVLYAIMSDVSAPEDRAIMYFFSSLAANLAVFAGPPVASKLIEVWSPWVPMSLSLIAAGVAGGIIILVPETAHSPKRSSQADVSCFGASDQGRRDAITSQFTRVFYNSDFRQLVKNRSVALLLLVFMLAAPLPTGIGSLFLQYYSKRFGKSIEDAGYMLAIRGGLTIIAVGVLLPMLSRFLSSPSHLELPGYRRDLFVARASAACAALGYFLLGGPNMAFLISGMIILALSAGLSPLCRSLISNVVRPDQTSQAFTIVSIVEGIGSLPAGPFLAWAFSSGMRLGDFWVGLPFYFLGSLGLITLVVLCFIDINPDMASFHTVAEEDYMQPNA